MAGHGTLPEAIIALRAEEAFLLKTGPRELVVDIRRQNEIIPAAQELQQI